MKVLFFALAVAVLVTACAHTSSDPGAIPYTLSQLDRQPEFLSCSRYEPPTSDHAGTSRRVRIRVLFDLSASGTAVNPQVVETGPFGGSGMRGVAREVARSCQYTPGIKDGRPVAVTGLSRMFVFRVGG